jgi:hypothetical protein
LLDAFFCPINPDIELLENPFPDLLHTLNSMGGGLIAPKMINPQGGDEDCFRQFPTMRELMKKALRGTKKWKNLVNRDPFFSDWIGGMFMLFRS